MNKVDGLNLAMSLLKKNCNVIPEKYVKYNGGYLFLAYPQGLKNKEKCLSPYYLVDIKTKKAGPFSPAFDFKGFFKIADKMKNV